MLYVTYISKNKKKKREREFDSHRPSPGYSRLITTAVVVSFLGLVIPGVEGQSLLSYMVLPSSILKFRLSLITPVFQKIEQR